MKRIAFYTLGCKVNQADTASMAKIFLKRGYAVEDFASEADIYLINTCVVTNAGQRKSRQMIRRAVRNHPCALIAVAGCYPQTAIKEVRELDGVDIIIGNQDRARIVELVEEAFAKKYGDILDNVQPMSVDTKFEELEAGAATDKTRAFLKIQEGCDQYCTYCIIPYARGPIRSRSLDSIRDEVDKLVAAGYKEVVLIGIHLGCYGKEQKILGRRISLCDAVAAALSVDGLRRLRLGSLESVEVGEDLLSLMAKEPRLCRHLHLPLQSGCDRILRAMHRPYDTAKFSQLLKDIRERLPGVAITTDLIVGFPSETEEDFKETLSFVRECGFAKVHIFPYSRRSGTPAAAMGEQIDDAIKAERAARVAQLEADMRRALLERMLGRTEEVLFEQPFCEGRMEGLCGPYIRVVAPGSEELAGQIRAVRIVGAEADFLLGELLD